jgi:hypothetical protein
MHVVALEPKQPLTRERGRSYEERSDEGGTREAHRLVTCVGKRLEMWEGMLCGRYVGMLCGRYVGMLCGRYVGMLCGRYVGMLCYVAMLAPSSAPPI